jgi:hypothetical protein
VDTSAFQNVIGQLAVTRTKEGYNFPEFLWPELCETQGTTLPRRRAHPRHRRIGDKAELVDEGEEFPEVGLNEEWIDTAPHEEARLHRPRDARDHRRRPHRPAAPARRPGGFWLGVNKEKRVIDVATGVRSTTTSATAPPPTRT